MSEIYSIGEFAKRAHITVKTLRHYEKLGLVMPSYNPDNGYRRYSERHFVQVETIMALKLLGFSLTEIGAFFKNNQHEIALDLAVQKQALAKKMQEIKQVISLIETIESRSQKNGVNDWVNLIKEMNMKTKDIDWYLNQTEEDMQKRGSHIPNEKETDMLKAKWEDLISRAYAQQQNFEPATFDVLAEEWIATVGLFIDKKSTMAAIFNSYAHMQDWPDDRKFFSVELGEFIGPKLIEKIA